MKDYNPIKIEAKWQKIWAKENSFQTLNENKNNKKKYILDMFPYPSGSGLHVGHPEGYIATDIYSRYFRMKKYSVLHPMGWDAFGLPAENYAIKSGIHPRESTKKNIKTFKRQINRLGLSYDWDKEIDTSDAEYYKWTQWLFIKLYENKLAYRKKAPVNWCPSCNTVLANEQVIDGKCHRCQSDVIQKNLKQWFFRITNYADQLLKDLDGLDWPEPIKLMQKNWIGKSEGAIINFPILNFKFSINVFTTRPDTLFGATYMVLAPENELILKIKNQILNWEEVEKYITNTNRKTYLQRTDLNKEKTGVELKGIKVINPASNKEIPIWIADYVLPNYGTGAIMAVPAHDTRDFEFATKFNLPIKFVIKNIKLKIQNDKPNIEYGRLINSNGYDGMTSEAGGKKIVKDLQNKGLAEFKIEYKLRDWLISRQRYWGAPIPIIYCGKCGIVPVFKKDLPVELPTDVDFKPTGESPLVNSKTFHNIKCPKCQSPARRESDTMDTFVDSSWYYLRYLDPHNEKVFSSKELINNWMPVDVYVGGAEHAVLHLLYSRFIYKALNEMNLVYGNEPFMHLINQGLILAENGKKMSKSLGNVINPDEIVDKYGADTFRLYEMFMGPLKDSKPWSTNSIIGAYRFLEKIWRFSQESDFSTSSSKETLIIFEKLKENISQDIESFSFNTAIAKLMEFLKHSKIYQITKELWSDYIKLLYPFAPHIACEIYYKLNDKNIWNRDWAILNKTIDISQEKQDLPVQINGKLKTVISMPSGLSQEKVKEIVVNNDKIKRIIGGNYKRIIIVSGKIVNIVV